ncbi:MAG: AzlC family ABC transporter permease [Nocardioidaceae bacterium]
MSQTVVVRHRDDVLEGVRAMMPMLVVYAPFGLLVGAAVAASDNPLAAWLSTWTVYGGAAHLAVLDVLRHGTGVLGAAVVGLLINARMVAYAASLAPHWRTASVRSRVAAAAMLTDATWGLTQNHPSDSAAVRRGSTSGPASPCGSDGPRSSPSGCSWATGSRMSRPPRSFPS